MFKTLQKLVGIVGIEPRSQTLRYRLTLFFFHFESSNFQIPFLYFDECQIQYVGLQIY